MHEQQRDEDKRKHEGDLKAMQLKSLQEREMMRDEVLSKVQLAFAQHARARARDSSLQARQRV